MSREEYYECEDDDTSTTITKQKRQYFPSSAMGYIVDAISGFKYPYKVGSKESLLFYKVVDATGMCDKDGRKLVLNLKSEPNREPNTCFYLSPEAYMVHRNVVIEPSKVERWHNMHTALFPNNNDINQDAYIQFKLGKLCL